SGNVSSYSAVVVPNGCFKPADPRRLTGITDDPPSTLMLVETSEESSGSWKAPVDADETRVMSPGSLTQRFQDEGANACSVDGMMRFLEARSPKRVRRALMSIDGNDDEVAKEW